MKIKNIIVRSMCILLVLLFATASFTGCSKVSEIPDGYQYATCKGEYFRLFVPTQWTVNTDTGVSGAYLSMTTENTVTMREVYFDPDAYLASKVTEPAETGADVTVEEDTTEDTTATETSLETAAATDSKAGLDYFIESHLEEISTLEGFEEKSRANTSLGRYRAWEITYVAKVNSKSYTFRQVLACAEGRYYIFTYSAPDEYYDAVLSEVDAILDEITFSAIPFDEGYERKIPEGISAPDGMKLVSDNSVAFRFFAPSDWVVDSKNKNCVVYFSEEDRSNVSVLTYIPEDEGVSVEDYWTYAENYYSITLDNYELVSETEGVKLGDRDATEYVYTYSIGNVEYKTKQVIAIYTTAVYIMTYTATPENYDLHTEDVSRMQEELLFRAPGKN